MLRRKFLNPSPLLDDSSSHVFDSSLTLIRVSRRAMATKFEVAIPYGTPNALPAANATLELIGDVETWMTVYDEESEVCRVNRDAATRPVEVSESLFGLLTQCATISAATNGAFNAVTARLRPGLGAGDGGIDAVS